MISVLQDEAVLAYQVLKHLLRVMLVIGSIILVFGNNYAFLLLDLYGGEHISEGSGNHGTIFIILHSYPLALQLVIGFKLNFMTCLKIFVQTLFLFKHFFYGQAGAQNIFLHHS